MVDLIQFNKQIKHSRSIKVMFGKLTDTANLLKAKITKDDLEEKLVQATSQENWQASTNILHELANAAYNYEKWQKINDFIWDKLKKKTTWRKVLKTLNLVEFLLKNGPPSILSSFKYDIYQFRTYSEFQLYEDGLDRGESIRQKSKLIVQLLSNDQLLEEEREKAKKIRERMSNVIGGSGMGYGGGSYGGGDSKYESYDSKSYKNSSKTQSYGLNNPFSTYGEYNYNKSTLDKYKNNSETEKSKNKTINITNPSTSSPSIVPGDDKKVEQKKPFSKIAPKLIKPSKPTGTTSAKPAGSTAKKPQAPKQTANFLDDDDFFGKGGSTSNSQVESKKTDFDFDFASQPTTQNNVQTNPPQSTLAQNPNYQQTPTLDFNIAPQQQPNPQQNMPQGLYGQQQFMQQPQYGQPQYGQPQQQYMQQPQQYLQFPNQQPQYPQQPPQPSYQNFNQAPTLSNPTMNQPNTAQYGGMNQMQGISLSTDKKAGNQQKQESNDKVNWLSSNQKGLIDFSDFSSQLNKGNDKQKKKSDENKNSIEIDMWNW